MSTCFDVAPRRQRGDVLIEALVGVLIAGIVGAGMASLMAKAMSAGYDARINSRVVSEVQDLLQRPGRDICDRQLGLSGARTVRITCEVEGHLNIRIGMSNNKVVLVPIQAPERRTLQVHGDDGDSLLEFSTGKTE